MTCKYKNSCLDCIDCDRLDFDKCKAYQNYIMQELTLENDGLFYEPQPDLFNSESEAENARD